MRKHLIVKLKQPASGAPFSVTISPGKFKVDVTGYGPSETDEFDKLNAILEDVHDDNTAAELHQSFPKFVARLRAIDAAPAPVSESVSQRALALYFRVTFPEITAETVVTDLEHQLQSTDVENVVASVTRVTGGYRLAIDGPQRYVEPPATGGVNVRNAWSLPGGTGGHVNICVVDRGYQENHPHLPSGNQITYVPPDPISRGADHGTAVLGILVSTTELAPVGIAHGARIYLAWTIRPSDDVVDGPVALDDPAATEDAINVFHALDDAFSNTAIALGERDVLLLEHQTEDNLPLEVHEDVRSFIEHATELGVTVVEPAGNGATDLDDPALPGGPLADPGALGAVMVGAGHSTTKARTAVSNYGSRVDCQSWGDGIYTLMHALIPPDRVPDDPALFDPNFGNTSGASAIIAGVVAVIQSINKAAGRPALVPGELRRKLKDAALGTPQPLAELAAEQIGPQPDVMKVLDDCDLLPDVFLRDNVADTGDEPSVEPWVFYSPDIITRNAVLPAGSAALDDWSRWKLSEPYVPGSTSFIYLRLDNRGPFDDHPTVKVYWAYPGAFLNPGDWKLIGETMLRVPGSWLGETTRVISKPIPWQTPTDTTHPCLIAVAESTLDPKPAPTDASTIEEYIALLQNYNNMAHRNVVAATLDSGMAFWRVNVEVPERRLPDSPETQVQLEPRGIPSGARLFVGLPRGRDGRDLLGGLELSELRIESRSHDELIREIRELSGRKRRRIEGLMNSPAGDRRELRLPKVWLAGPARRIAIPTVATRPGRPVPLFFGLVAPRRMDLSRAAIRVSQSSGRRRLGQVNLTIA